jgi:hypothetical protein
VAPLSDGRLELWASAGDGRLYTTWKLDGDPNAAWAPWYDFYGDVGDLPGGAGELAVVQLMDRRLILWAIAGNGVIYASWKTSDDPNAGWSPWSDFYGEVGGLAAGARSLAVAPLTDGRLELWATDGNGALLTTWQAVRDPNSSWVGWNDFGASAGWLAGGARAVAVGPLSDGRLELWATDAYGSLLSSWKVTTDPNAGWTPWTEFVL